MDRRERIDDGVVTARATLSGWQANIWTALPAIVEAVDLTKKTVSLQPAIQAQVRNKEGVWSNVTLPVLTDCPIVFPGGGGFTLTFPIAKGDEGIVLIASRCIDSWWQSGGVQPQAELRMHDLSDGMFIPGLSSIPNVPTTIATDKVQLRNSAGSHVFELSATGWKFTGNVEFVNDLLIDGALHVDGNLQVDGTIQSTGNITSTTGAVQAHGDVVSTDGNVHAGGNVQAGAAVTAASDIIARFGSPGFVTLTGHIHNGVTAGANISGSPVPGT